MQGGLTVKHGCLSLSRLTSTLKGASIEEIQQDAIRQLLSVFIRETRCFELGHVVTFGHVTTARVNIRWREDQIAFFVDPDKSSLPEKRIGELDIDLTNIGWLMGSLGGRLRLLLWNWNRSSIFFFERWGWTQCTKETST